MVSTPSRCMNGRPPAGRSQRTGCGGWEGGLHRRPSRRRNARRRIVPAEAHLGHQDGLVTTALDGTTDLLGATSVHRCGIDDRRPHRCWLDGVDRTVVVGSRSTSRRWPMPKITGWTSTGPAQLSRLHCLSCMPRFSSRVAARLPLLHGPCAPQSSYFSAVGSGRMRDLTRGSGPPLPTNGAQMTVQVSLGACPDCADAAPSGLHRALQGRIGQTRMHGAHPPAPEWGGKVAGRAPDPLGPVVPDRSAAACPSPATNGVLFGVGRAGLADGGSLKPGNPGGSAQRHRFRSRSPAASDLCIAQQPRGRAPLRACGDPDRTCGIRGCDDGTPAGKASLVEDGGHESRHSRSVTSPVPSARPSSSRHPSVRNPR